MRHRVAGVKLSRTTAHRRALFRNLVTALLEHEIIRTTDAKAKETRRWADRMITLGKQGTLHARRRAATVLRRASVVKKLFDDLAPRYAERHGGYTRVVKLGHRLGAAAHLSVVELVERKGAETEQVARRRRGRHVGDRTVWTSVEEPRGCAAGKGGGLGASGSVQRGGAARATGRPPGDAGSRPRLCRGRATGSGGIGAAQGAAQPR